jgi:hypothetical protein
MSVLYYFPFRNSLGLGLNEFILIFVCLDSHSVGSGHPTFAVKTHVFTKKKVTFGEIPHINSLYYALYYFHISIVQVACTTQHMYVNVGSCRGQAK